MLSCRSRDCLEIGGADAEAIVSRLFSDQGWRVAWIVRLVKTGANGEEQSADVMQINRPDELGVIANLGLTLAEGKLVLAGLQQQIVAAQAKGHAVRRPDCRSCGDVCRVKDYRDHAVATLFGQVTVRLPRFRCAGCGGNEAGHDWPSHCRSTPELDQLQAHLSALMPYRVAADVLRQMFPAGAGNDPETLRCHTLKIGGELRDQPAVRPDPRAPAITVTLDSTFIRSCEDGERHLEVRVGNVETEAGGRQVFGAVAKADTDIKVLIRRNLDAVGQTDNTVLTAFTDGCSGLRRILGKGSDRRGGRTAALAAVERQSQGGSNQHQSYPRGHASFSVRTRSAEVHPALAKIMDRLARAG
jgi:hypothetical protein